MKKSKKISKIAEILPEGLSQATVKQIAELVNEAITEGVQAKIDSINSGFVAFTRLKLDSLKELAIKELEEENSSIRDASVFNEIKSLMAVELCAQDNDNAVMIMANEAKELDEGITAITEEFNKAIAENTKYEQVIQALSEKIEALEAKLNTSLTENTKLQEVSKKPFKSSEKAKIISEHKERIEAPAVQNEFLTDEVLKFTKQIG